MSLLALKVCRKLIAIILENDTPAMVALGFSLGMLLGLHPFNILYFFLIALLILLFKTNIGASFLGVLLFSLISPLFKGLSNKIGTWLLLDTPSLRPLFETLYSAPLLPYLNFNNTYILGSLVLGMLLFLPVFFGFYAFIRYLRSTLKARLERAKWVKWLKASTLFRWGLALKRILS